MHRHDRRGAAWRAVAAGGIVAAAVGLGGIGAPAGAQSGPNGEDLADQFGGIDLSGRANGVQLTYDVENVFPLPAPLFQASIPESTATMASGPSSFALGSLAYPGNVVANLPGVIAQSNPEYASYVPPYPIRATAEHPSGPPDATQQVGTAQSAVTANDSRATALTSMSGADLPQFLRIGSITTSAQSELLPGAAESRSRVELTGVDLLFGLLHFDSIVTDLVATSDGVAAASAGGTTITGFRFLGIEATLGPEGITLAQPPEARPVGPLTPLSENLPGLAPLTDPIGQAVIPANGAIGQLLATGTATADQLLAAAGIRVRLLQPFEAVDGSSAERTANGLVVDIEYDGQGDNPLAQLLALIPAESLPSDSPPEVPVNVSPQALVSLLKETHVTGFAIGYGNVSARATEAFQFVSQFRPTARPAAGLGPSGASGLGPSAGFATAAPAPGTAAAPGGAAGAVPASAGLVTAAGVGALVAVALATSPLWAVGSRRLAQSVLGATTSSCPEGRDDPHDPGRA